MIFIKTFITWFFLIAIVNAKAIWIKDLRPIRNPPNHVSSVISDIESHMPTNHIYRSSNMITWAHETTHGLNSRLRGMVNGNRNVFYCLDGRCVALLEPKVTISMIASAVPRNRRNDIYQLYLVQQAGSWNNQPLYVLDEWSAYLNGSACIVELWEKGSPPRGNEKWSYTLEVANQFMYFALALWQTVERNDPNYSEKEDLLMFLRYQSKRTLDLTDRAKKIGLWGK